MNKTIGVDLGSSFIRYVLPGEEAQYFEEPSVIAVENSGKVSACGNAALLLAGRVPGSVKLIHPFSGTATPEPAYAKAMLTYLIKNAKAKGADLYFSLAGEQDDETEQIIVDAAQAAGARDVLAVDAAYAASRGCRVNAVSESAVVNIGSSIVDMVSYLHAKPAAFGRNRFSGDAFDEAIISYIFKKYHVKIQKDEAEKIKKELGSLTPTGHRTAEISVMRPSVGLPKKITVTEEEISASLEPVFDELADDIIAMIRPLSCEPDKIILTGGGANLNGLAPALAPLVCLPVEIAKEPEYAVIRGLAALMNKSK